MSYTFIQLDEKHNDALLDLADLNNHGGKDFRISRRPDFFALPRALGKFHYYGIIKNNLPVAVIGITEQQRMVAGKEETALYFHDLKVHPGLGGPMAYYRLVEGITKIYSEEDGKKVMFSVILESNQNVRAIT